MFVDLPLNLMLTGLGAFVLGWVLSVLNSALSQRTRAKKRDARDDRIRSLEAELRVAQTDLEKARESSAEVEKQLDDSLEGIEKRDNVISHQQDKMDNLKRDLTDSVKKTRELRAELTNRATENVKSEAKLREVETELSIAQASTDLIATGVLDYSIAPETPEEDNDEDAGDVPKTAS
ncbi:MAG: hypothetical protein AAGA44_14140 [Pseudomonadota bacterium]